MFRLTVLGQIDLRDDTDAEVRPVLAQPKRLALLVYLAVSAPWRFYRRDELLAMFWPELSDERARNALRQALHQLRRTMGAAVVVARGADDIGLDAQQITCDAVDFHTALDRGMLDSAIDSYRGDLLPGFVVDGAGAFNAWLDETRIQLRHRATRAAWALAEQHEKSGELDRAAASARRALDLVTDDESALRQLVALLDRVGDPSGAIRAVRELCHAPAARPRGGNCLPPASSSLPLIRSRGLALNGAGAQQTARMSHVDASRAPRRAGVLVTCFENLTGDATFDFIGRLVSTAVRQALSETRVVQVRSDGGPDADNAAIEDEARLTISGSYHAVDAGWHVSATVHSRETGRSVGTSRQRPPRASARGKRLTSSGSA
jgi:serine/threonine-protein kinase